MIDARSLAEIVCERYIRYDGLCRKLEQKRHQVQEARAAWARTGSRKTMTNVITQAMACSDSEKPALVTSKTSRVANAANVMRGKGEVESLVSVRMQWRAGMLKSQHSRKAICKAFTTLGTIHDDSW
mmetsp:Transcript_11251/g.24222  ORF Transcript_11251/g.24222 Transcript_11251/m.24222 type:complete len:127 (+) Transcript_11251:130-510(+)|eukprot:CAMPEP_0185847196 /NCGR_PEP_ID=MMETSP1354-20130828/2565_1 /TAXON_ID=708628 /ORGANISM="Erythrolobus madagascarensis, Strain CCMP3276" /LENGTH=126 /DNA_ID=CAMNT_0028547459 /DNA_START=121 /DNA_END=498 /DNA_ORIENTATION=-